MVDQTQDEWRAGIRNNDLGTLVLLTTYLNATLLDLITRYPTRTITWEKEGLTKLYISNVPYGVVRSLKLGARFDFAWLPKRLRPDIRKCGGEDCTASKKCVKPGCICKEVGSTGKWKCR